MNRITGQVAVTALACFFATIVQGQISALPKWEVGLGAGPFLYQGDLAPSALGSYKTLRPGISIFGSRLLNRFLALRTSLTFTGLSGDDLKYGNVAWREARGLNFHTSVFEVSETVVWDLLGNNDNHYRTRFSPYVFGGIGYSFLRVRRDASRFNTSYFGAESTVTNGLTADLAHTMPRGIPMIPVGVGVRYSISPAWSISLESAYRFTFTDYLDGFSKVGDPAKKDHYYGVTVGVIYTFLKSKELKCPRKVQ
ncbi:MAG TPA: DUF6089 family protein [Puia sp.]|nr:DUF6089 family protein [Puia sp.]